MIMNIPKTMRAIDNVIDDINLNYMQGHESIDEICRIEAKLDAFLAGKIDEIMKPEAIKEILKK